MEKLQHSDENKLLHTHKEGGRTMEHVRKHEKGFTLVEILIVVIILAVLAGMIIPQFSSSTEEAKLSTLRADLATLRSSTELYYHQHNSIYPGAVASGYGTSSTEAEYLVDQLTLYTDVAGTAVSVKDAAHKYGPYLKKGLPANPFDDSSVMAVDVAQADLSLAAPDGSGGWMFFALTGQLFANDGAHDTF
jgi:general secretion pathway protein G